ncbi:peptidoglycan-binding protein [Clostridium sporogenes]|uniref:Peptidoglycan-binding protein n=1 Tax=Clostridium sporogenes TaxID=1509 RepID=A0AAE4FME5_CLOSG|nr:peptidoglycan-binding protein [Clostridium sporogenes]MDS1005024.1 peptidoglycan-binding protein [Clostridium sporogenes]
MKGIDISMHNSSINFGAVKNSGINVIPTLDIETNNQGRSRSQISDRCIQFLLKFKSLSGYNCMVYTGGFFGRDNLDSRVKQYPGWIAHYGVNTPMETGFNVVGHQYTETGKINGVNGNVDLNNFTDKIFISANKINNNSDSNRSTSTIYGKHSLINSLQQEIIGQGFGSIKVDGIAGEATLNAAPIVKKGARGKISKIIQQMLINIGYSVGSYASDGVFGDGTVTAIKAFQRDSNLSADGIVGKETWKKLFRNLK